VAAKDAQLLPEQKSYGQVNSGGGTNLKEGGGHKFRRIVLLHV